MDVKTKSSTKSKPSGPSDSFLFDAIRPQSRNFSLGDGFRFGLGFMLAALIVGLIIGAVAFGIATKFPFS